MQCNSMCTIKEHGAVSFINARVSAMIFVVRFCPEIIIKSREVRRRYIAAGG